MRGNGGRQLLVCRDFPFIINLTRHFCYYRRVEESWRDCRRRSPELMNFSNFSQDKWLQLRFTPASRCNVNPTIKQLSSNFHQFHYTLHSYIPPTIFIFLDFSIFQFYFQHFPLSSLSFYIDWKEQHWLLLKFEWSPSEQH